MKKVILKLRAKFFRWLHRPRMLNNIYFNADGTMANNTRFSSTTNIINKEKIFVGDNVYIGHYVILDGTGGLEIEEGCQLSAKVSILTHSSHISIRLFGRKYDLCEGTENEGYKIGKIKIGKFTFVGTGATITNGVTIGKGCVVGANSFVNTNLPDYAIAYGSPASIVGDSRNLDRQYLENNKQFLKYYDEWNNEE